MKNLLITFDYELFLGERSGGIEDCLIIPTNKITEILDYFSIIGVFFIDTTYLLKLKAQNNIHTNKDFRALKDHIKYIVSKGHYIFPHIHPHWLDAYYDLDLNEWRLTNLKNYRFSNLDEKDRVKIFGDSMAILNEILSEVAPNYKIDGFRAGGWCIQPFQYFKNEFEKFGIKYDFSVMANQAYFSKAQFYDFRSVPSLPIYRFEDEPTHQNIDGKFTEFSISSIRLSKPLKFLNKIWLKYLWKMGDRSFGKGKGVIADDVSELLNPGLEMLSIELINSLKLPKYLQFTAKNDYIHFISHPKMLTPHTIRVFQSYLEDIFRRYDIETDFKKFKFGE